MQSISEWLQSLGLEQYEQAFIDNDIDVGLVARLSEQDLKELSVSSMGHRKKLLEAIAQIGEQGASPTTGVDQSLATDTAERRQLTVMFCDLVGSTELSQKLDPEALREVMRNYQRTCRTVIERYDGHVAQYLGDGLMTYFGWPRAHEDDAERAIRAALDIVEAVKHVGAPEALRVRIGIATGPVVVGETGDGDASVPKVAVGETPNVAARIQGLAEADQIIIGPDTRRLVGGAFTLADFGEHTLKGIVEPVHAWRVSGLGAVEGRFDAAHGQSRLTPLVGRDLELGLLMDRWARAQEGEGQVVLLSGDPGIGKSRILSALRERLATDGAKAMRFQCSPYYVNSAFWPSIDNFERTLHFARDESTESKLDKLESLIVGHYQRPLSDVRFIASMLSIACDERYGELPMTPQKFKSETLRTLVDLTEAGARKQPSVLLFEDLHWADPTTLEVLDLLVDRVRTIPLLIVLTHRPEFANRWADHGHVSALDLSKLTYRQCSAMVSNLTHNKALPSDLLEQILAKTDGVPLFVEELTKSILESGELKEEADHYQYIGNTRSVTVPATLRDSLMARLDRYAPVKEIAQIGAAIGREFSYELIAVVAPLQQRQLDDALSQLIDSGLAFRRGTPPEATYTFKHALVQDAAYDSLLKSRRQLLHKRIAETLEQRFRELVKDQPEVVAHHYTEAGLNEQATHYWLNAGQRGVERFANTEAISYLTRGLKTLESFPHGQQRDRLELLLQTKLGNALGSSKGYTPPEVGKAFARARELWENATDISEMLSILTGLSVYYMMRGNYAESFAVDEEIFALARKSGDAGSIVTAHSRRGFTKVFTGEFKESIAHGDAGFEAYDRNLHANLAVRYGYDMGIACLDFTAWALLLTGFPDQAAKRHARALEYATQSGHPLTLAMVVVHIACLDALRDDATAALSHAQDVISYCKENSIYIRQVEGEILEGWALSELGDPAKGVPIIEAAIEAWLQLGAQIANPSWYLHLSRAYANSGRVADAQRALERAFDAANRNAERTVEPELHRYEGDLWLTSNGSQEKAEQSYRKAIELASELEARWWLLRAATSLARLWQQQGKRKEAHDLLAPVYNWFTEGFDTKDLKEAKALLEELSV